jgi:hypothetical protein
MLYNTIYLVVVGEFVMGRGIWSPGNYYNRVVLSKEKSCRMLLYGLGELNRN